MNKINKDDMKNLSTKIQEVQAIFLIGQRVVPILEELFVFVEEMIPIMEEVSKSINDSYSNMPQATEKLDNVTMETEAATGQIMDTADQIGDASGNIAGTISEGIGNLKELGEISPNIFDDVKSLLNLLDPATLSTEQASKKDNLLKSFDNYFVKQLNIIKSLGTGLSSAKQMAEKIQNDSFGIYTALQFQDITTQQIHHANSILETIEDRLQRLMRNLQNIGNQILESGEEKTSKREGIFDPNASYFNGKERQKAANEIQDTFEDEDTEGMSDAVSQDEIDQLLGNATADTAQEEVESPVVDDLSETVSQDDIDNLLNEDFSLEDDSESKDDLSETVSQDDIDDLLNDDFELGSEKEEETSEPEAMLEEISQDEIDKFLQDESGNLAEDEADELISDENLEIDEAGDDAGDLNEPISQEEIDRLLSGT